MDNYIIAETDDFIKKIKTINYKNLYKKIVEYVYPMLRRNPYYGPNIKRLRGNLSNYYRYRIGDYRLFYQIKNKKIMIFVMDIKHRKDAYD